MKNYARGPTGAPTPRRRTYPHPREKPSFHTGGCTVIQRQKLPSTMIWCSESASSRMCSSSEVCFFLRHRYHYTYESKEGDAYVFLLFLANARDLLFDSLSVKYRLYTQQYSCLLRYFGTRECTYSNYRSSPFCFIRRPARQRSVLRGHCEAHIYIYIYIYIYVYIHIYVYIYM